MYSRVTSPAPVVLYPGLQRDHHVPTRVCAFCAGQGPLERVRAGLVIPAWAPAAAALLLPMALDGLVRAAWSGHDLYALVANEWKPSQATAVLLSAAPGLLPALAGLLLWAAWAARGGYLFSACPRCVRRHRAWRRARAALFLALPPILGAAAYLGRLLPMDERRWGLLFVPWVVVVVVAEQWGRVGGLRQQSLWGGEVAVRGAPALGEVLAAEGSGWKSDRLPSRTAPHWLALVGWLLPLGAALALHQFERLEFWPHTCAWGTWPLSHRSGAARLVGCHSADGSRHGLMEGGAGGWNSSSTLGFRGQWVFGQPDGAFEFRDAPGVLRVEGSFARGTPTGVWTLRDDRGEVLERYDVEAATFLQTHPHLRCPEGAVPVMAGGFLYAERACRDGERNVGPYVMVRDGVVAEVGRR